MDSNARLILDVWIPSSSFRRSSAISASKDFKVSAEDSDACRMRLGWWTLSSKMINPRVSKLRRVERRGHEIKTCKNSCNLSIFGKESYLQSQSSKSFCRCSKKFLATSPSSSSGVCWNSSKTSRTLSAGCNVCQVETWPELPYWLIGYVSWNRETGKLHTKSGFPLEFHFQKHPEFCGTCRCVAKKESNLTGSSKSSENPWLSKAAFIAL